MLTGRPSPTLFLRTRLTWQSYLLISYYSYLLNVLGPITPFLRDELGLTYTQASLHFSAYAVGVILSGLALHWLSGRFGIYPLVWGGAVGMALGAVLLTVGRAAPVTIAGAFAMGLLGVYVVALMNMTLAEVHHEHSAVAFTESAMIASLFAALSPAAVGFFARTALSWRAALWVMLFALPPLWLAFRKQVLRGADARPMQPAARETRPSPISGGSGVSHAGRTPFAMRLILDLPLVYWFYWLAIMMAVAVEFCIIFWAADYLEKVMGLAKADAALAVSAFLGAMLVGRAINSRLLFIMRSPRLLLISLLISGAGFVLFWLAPGALLAVVGLLVAGLGVAGIFPIINALALEQAPDQMVAASGRISLAVGIAILLLPLLLGRLADWTGIRAAYGMVAVIIALALALTQAAEKLKQNGL